MKLTSEQEQQLTQVYEAYWAQYLKGNVQAMEVLLDESYTQVGSAESEVFSTKKQAVKFLKDTIDEVVGKLEMRNRVTKMEQQDAIVMFHERCDLYALNGQQWVFYSKFRATTLLTERKDGWKITHQHSSFPDSKTEEGQNVAIDKIAEENRELREAVKRRTAELEQKNRELAIEASLERVRARAMAMQNSDELSELVDTVFKELTKLDLALSWCMINIIDEVTMSNTVWGANPEIGKAPESYHMLFEDYRFHHEMFKAWKENKDKWVFVLKGAEKETYDEYLFTQTEFRRVPEPVQKEMRASKQYVASFTFSNFGGLQTVGEEPLSDESLDILSRFGKVFDLTYTRFNDLQKAEAQAREAGIEGALERVRSRSMGMQKSEELREVVKVIFDQLSHLSINAEHAGIVVDYEPKKDFHFWVADNQDIPARITVPYLDLVWDRQFTEAKKKGNDFFTTQLDFEEKNRFYKKLLPHIEGLTKQAQDFYFSCRGLAASTVIEKDIGLYIENFSGTPYSEKENDILKRFARVFQQTYTRFLDLQKAEAQAREAQIEGALERVRSRTMAMHNSEDLENIVISLFDEVMKLGLDKSMRCGIGILEGHEGMETRSVNSNSDGTVELRVGMLNMTIHPMLVGLKKAWKKGSKRYSYNYTTEDVRKYYEALNNEPEYPFNANLETLPEREFHQSFFYSSGIIFAFSKNPISEESSKILARFAAVFGQTYRRYLDLQKAEIQAREAQIEAALERVRAKSMAMYKSEELPETAQVLFEQFSLLGNMPDRISIGIFKEEEKLIELWVTDQIGSQIDHKYSGPLDEATTMSKMHKAWKGGKDSVIIDLSGQKLKDWVRYIKEDMKMYIDDSHIKGRRVQQAAFFSKGMLLCTTNEPVSDEVMQLLIRFAKVFDQTYTRFLDLQKAEAQAREARIEAALERVRAASMAMHKTNELAQVVMVLFQQFSELELDFYQVWINIFFIEEGYSNCWFSPVEGVIEEAYTARVPLAPFEESSIKSWRAGEEFSYLSWRGLKEVDEIAKSLSEMTGHESFIRIQKKKRMDRMEIVDSNHKYGVLAMAKNNDITDNDRTILKRFSKVFEQTYTRFLDLQKAEAQAREAQIETALERVRSRTMAMQRSEELTQVADVLFGQIQELGTTGLRRCVICILNKSASSFELWYTSEDGHSNTKSIIIPTTGNDVAKWITKSWKEKRTNSKELEGTDIKEFVEFLENHGWIYPKGEKPPKYMVLSVCPFSHGILMPVTYKQLGKSELELLQRFASVFQQTYTRFLDLELAEERAKDAIKEASLDRVRGEIASMRSTEDLQRITPLVFNELTSLGVPFFRCGVFIIHEKEKKLEVYLSAPGGHSLGVLNLPFNVNSLTQNSVENWKKNKVYHQHWDKEEFVAWTQSMLERGQIQDAAIYQGAEAPPDSLDLHFIPFTQGMLYVGNTKQLEEGDIDLVRSLAEAFAIAYARYEDFTKLERAKESIETTLTELKTTQNQLVQSEKMASLGELTAGIAHEIQNPLNFVNNFSEVSVELIEEMHEELEKGDFKEAMALAEDVKQNLDKITHHGKRADGIVKGMLQHSRSSSGEKEPTDINVLADEYLRLAYHGLRAKDKSFNANMKTDFDENIGKINIIPQDIGRVVLNLITNAFYAVSERKLQQPEGYEPTVSVSTKKTGNQILISVKDNGNGIPKKVLDKIFQPFFTTKPTGQGTGLGLSLSYDIVTAHRGEISVKSKVGEGTAFTIALPA